MKTTQKTKTWTEVFFTNTLTTIEWTDMSYYQEVHLTLPDAGIYFWVFTNDATGEKPTVRWYILANDGQSEGHNIHTIPEMVDYIKEQMPEAYNDAEVQKHLILPLLQLA